MSNEVLLILSLIIIYGMVVVLFKFFGLEGLYMWTIIATIAANIEVLIYIEAFGMEMTLGNVLFASTFLVTDIISELYDRAAANKAVKLGILTSIIFVLISQFWLLYTPHPTKDVVMPSMKLIFGNVPRVMMASLIVYAVAQTFDVWCYHKWWALTSKLSGDKDKFLWLRNNGSTMISQLLNTVLYTLFAFWGTFSKDMIVNIIISSYIIFIVTSILDTPFVYLARWMKKYVEN